MHAGEGASNNGHSYDAHESTDGGDSQSAESDASEEGDEDDMLQRMLHSHRAARQKPARHKANTARRTDGVEAAADELQAGLHVKSTTAEQVLLLRSWPREIPAFTSAALTPKHSHAQLLQAPSVGKPRDWLS